MNDYCFNHYYQTYARIPPYLIGILLGWVLHIAKDREINMNKVRSMVVTFRKQLSNNEGVWRES